MRKLQIYVFCLLFTLFGITTFAIAQLPSSNYNEQGGLRTVIGGSIDVISGGEIDVESGGALKIAGTSVTSTAAELNAMDGITSTTAELNILDGVTSTAAELNFNDLTTGLGTAEASKTLTLDSSSNMAMPAAGTITFTSGSGLSVPDGGTLTLDATSVTSTGAELNLLDGSLEANSVVSVVPVLDSAGALRTAENIGTPGTGVTAVEYGDGYNHVTVLTLTAAALTPTTIPADAEGAGVIAYTFPAGDYLFTACHMDITAFTGTGFAATNAVDMGIGSLISSGDIATLTSATMEDCVTGQTVADISSPATEKSTVATAGAPLLFEAAGSHVIHLNVAGTWNDTFTAPVVTGTITLYWTFLGA